MRRILIVALLLFPVLLSAQTPTGAVVPPSVGAHVVAGVDALGEIIKYTDELNTHGSPTLLLAGWILLAFWVVYGYAAMVIRNFIGIARVVISHSYHSGLPNEIVADFVVHTMRCVITATLLTAMVVPVGGLKLYQVFPSIADDLTKAVMVENLQDVLQGLAWVVQYIPAPSVIYPLFSMVYMLILVFVAIAQVCMMLITAFSYFGVGLGTIAGYLIIPFFAATNQWRGRFWHWIDWMSTASLYRFFGAAYVSVVSHVYLDFFNHSVNGDYSFSRWIALIAMMLLISGMALFFAFKVPAITDRLFGGAGSMGQAWAGALETAIVGGVMAL